MSEAVKFFLEGVCTGFLGLFGIVGNVVSIAVLSSTDLDMMPSFRHLLKMLAAFDATFLVFTFGIFCISAWSDHYNVFIKPWLIPYFLPVIQVMLPALVGKRNLSVLSFKIVWLFKVLTLKNFKCFHQPEAFNSTVVFRLTSRHLAFFLNTRKALVCAQ